MKFSQVFASTGSGGQFLDASQIKGLPKAPWFLETGHAAGRNFSKKQLQICYERPPRRPLAIEVFFLDSPFGLMALGFSKRGLCRLDFPASQKDVRREYRRHRLSKGIAFRFPENPEENGFFSKTTSTIQEIMAGKALRQPLSLHLLGSPFQCSVWEMLLRIPRGCVTSYGELARVLGNPKAARAVGGAVGKNPVSFLVPCHRVLPKDRSLGHYHWGSQKKAALLRSEGSWGL